MDLGMDLRGKVVVVTGASRGLGAALVSEAAAAGAQVGACSRGEMPAADPGTAVLSTRLDVRDPAALSAFADQVVAAFGPIDLWINNAGVLGPVTPLRDGDPDAFAEALAINVNGVLFGSRVFAGMCRRQRHRGVLLNLSSGAARAPYAGWSAYCASKAAVDRLSEVLALEEQGWLRVHAVAPGVFESAMQETVRASTKENFPELERFQRLHREGQLADPKVVAMHLLRLGFHKGAGSWPVCVDLRELPQN